MKNKQLFYLVAGITAMIFVAGVWYVYKYRDCAKMISYIPSREGRDAGSGFYGAIHSLDKGDYYILGGHKFKTSKDAMRACIWK